MGQSALMTVELDEQAQDPVDALAEDFLRRRRLGERPTLEEYARRHPEWAERIREVFLMLNVLEDLGTFRLAALTHDDRPRAAATLHPAPQELGDYRVL